MTDQLNQQQPDNNGTVTIPLPVPIIIQLNDPEEDDNVVKSHPPEGSFISPPTSVNVASSPSLPSAPKIVNGNNDTGLGKSLLGADLLQKSASLAMPPPSSTTIKKTRKLVSPGMSMVKWMKLQESRVRPPTRKKIKLSEIAKHNSEQDCWMVIRNCVYDVTEYLPYHPGGIPELMKGAGKDATALFNEVHRWVNFDSILRSCLQGYLQIEVGESFEETEEQITAQNLSLVPLRKGPIMLPETKFSQNDTDLMLQVDTGYTDELSDDNWCVSVLNRERLLLKVILKPPELWVAHLKLLQRLKDDRVFVNFQNSSKRAVITIKKPSIGQWKSLGAPLRDNNKLMDSRNCIADDDYSIGTIVEKEFLTHNVILIGIQVVSSSFIGVPVGFHLKLRLVDGNAPARKYTPVIKSLLVVEHGSGDNATTQTVLKSDVENNPGKLIYFIIKIYPDGQLTKEIGLLQINSQLELGAVAGRYDPSFFSECDTLALIAGGSGVTPFVRIADFLKKRSATYPISRILLIFFNHSEQDIIWKDQWTEFANSWNIFHFFPVISTPKATWKGLTGRVDNMHLFETILLQTLGPTTTTTTEKIDSTLFGKFKAMLCGSSGFNEAFVTMLKNQSVVQTSATDEDLFIF